MKSMNLRSVGGLLKAIFPFLGLVGVIAFFQIYTGGMVLTGSNLTAVFNEGFYIMIGASGICFIIAMGNLDFSIGSIMGFSCAIAAMTAKAISPYASPVFAMLTGLCFGVVNGLVHTKLHVGALIATMSTQMIISGLLVLMLSGSSLSAPFSMLRWNSLELKVTVLVIVVALFWVLFHLTAYGKNCRAIGSCMETARQSGVNVDRTKIASFAVMGALAGLLGFFSLIRTGTSTVLTGNDLYINVLCAALLGGLPLMGGAAATFRSVVIGSATMSFLTNGMILMSLSTYDQQLVKGIIFLITIAISFDRRNLRVIK